MHAVGHSSEDDDDADGPDQTFKSSKIYWKPHLALIPRLERIASRALESLVSFLLSKIILISFMLIFGKFS